MGIFDSTFLIFFIIVTFVLIVRVAKGNGSSSTTQDHAEDTDDLFSNDNPFDSDVSADD